MEPEQAWALWLVAAGVVVGVVLWLCWLLWGLASWLEKPRPDDEDYPGGR